MSKLVAELKAEHVVILQRLDEARAVHLDSAALKNTLLFARKKLVAHLTKEDARFYPPLLRAARGDPRLASMLSFFRGDLHEVSREVFGFYAGVESGSLDDGLLDRFRVVSVRLRSRIGKEENLLYPEFVKLGID
jgi:hypothetical protein